MDAAAVLNELTSLGISVILAGDEIVCRPGSRIPAELKPAIRANKPEIIGRLRAQAKNLYEPAFPNDSDNINELQRRVREEGYVLCYASELDDLVAFHRDDLDPRKLPPEFVPYSERELEQLFGNDGPELSPNALRLLHQAKITGAGVTNSQTEHKTDNAGKDKA